MENKKHIDKHVTINTNNFIFLTDLKTQLLISGNKTNYSELINLAIETLKRQLNQTNQDKIGQINKALNKIREL